MPLPVVRHEFVSIGLSSLAGSDTQLSGNTLTWKKIKRPLTRSGRAAHGSFLKGRIGPVTNSRNLLYANDGAGKFTLQSDSAGLSGPAVGIGDAAAVADYNLDGFLDIAVVNGAGQPPFDRGPTSIYRNEGNGNHWLELALSGTKSNRDAVGARVALTAGGVTQWRTQSGGFHARAQNWSTLHFGLAGETMVERIEIHWPSGQLQQLEQVEADQLLQVIEP